MIFLPLGDGIYQGEGERFYSPALLLLLKYVRKQLYLLTYLFIYCAYLQFAEPHIEKRIQRWCSSLA